MDETEYIDFSDPTLPTVADLEAYERMRNGNGAEPFSGLSHAEVLELEFPPERMLVSDLVPIGAVGTIAGVPETYKSWLAQRMAVMVASGEGEMFGKGVEHSGPVGYFWQDDSTREEAERVKLYDKVSGTRPELPVRWFLNEGLALPAHIDRLRMTISEYGLVLVVLDSFYNVLFGKDLKSDEAERAIAELKSSICDATGCTVVIVDHMPWATETNRGRLRSYGGVFKGAATRFGIYIDAVASKLWVEARGNNIVGFKRTLAEWDAEQLEMKLIDAREVISEEDYDQRILDFLAEHGEVGTDRLNGGKNNVKGHKVELTAARERLLERGEIESYKRTGSRKILWKLSNHAGYSGSSASEENLTLDVSTSSSDEEDAKEPVERKTSNDATSSGSPSQKNPLENEELIERVPSSSGSPLRGENREEPDELLGTDADGIPF